MLAGDLIAEQEKLISGMEGEYKMHEKIARLHTETCKAVKNLDTFLKAISDNVLVDIMPGDQDPSDDRLPQQPLNESYFSQSHTNSNLTAVTNPYEFEVNDVRLHGTSGNPALFTYRNNS